MGICELSPVNLFFLNLAKRVRGELSPVLQVKGLGLRLGTLIAVGCIEILENTLYHSKLLL
jgi:hypothetical protein